MALALSDLIVALVPDEVKNLMLDVAVTYELATTTWKEGDPERSILAIVARQLSDRDAHLVKAVAGGLLDYAEADWLTLLARNVYNVTRIEATFASGDITLTNSTGAPIAVAIGDMVVQNPTTKKLYRNTTGGTVDASDTLELSFLAEEAGSASSSAATTITAVVTGPLGVTVSNAGALIGNDKELDPALRQRCRDSLGALSPNGASSAYDFVAKSTKRADGTTIDINRTSKSANSSTGQVTVYIAAPGGAPAGADVTLINTAIQDKVVPVTATCTVAGATNKLFPITYTGYVSSKDPRTDAEILAAVAAALAEYFKEAAIGGFKKTPGGQGKVWHDVLRGVISDGSRVLQTSPPAFLTVDLTTPAADTDVAVSEVPVLSTITPTITRVSQS